MVVLLVIAVLGIIGSAYFGVKTNRLKQDLVNFDRMRGQKLERVQKYVDVLEKFEKFKRTEGAGKTTGDLEKAVETTGNGVLKNLLDEVLLGGNLKEDMDYFLDAVIDSMKFFSEIK